MTDTSREAFEAFIQVHYPYESLSRWKDGSYKVMATDDCWESWQASRNALAAEQAQAVEPAGYFLRDRSAPDDWRFHYTDPRPVKPEYEVQPLFFPQQVAVPQKIGDSRFESWYGETKIQQMGTKQRYREAYEAGLNEAQQVAVPATDGEIYTAYITATNQTLRPQDERLALKFARAIEAHHGIGAKQ
jgi:hypothetical protein